MKTENTKLTVIVGLMTTSLVTFLMTFIFYTAYFNGHSVVVTVNSIGEADLEAFVVFPLLIFVLCFSIYIGIRDYYDSLWTNKIEFKKPKEVET